MTNLGQQGQNASNLTHAGMQMNSDWLTGSQNLGNLGMSALSGNTQALGMYGDTAFRQVAAQQATDQARNAITGKVIDNAAEDLRARQAQGSAEQIAAADRAEAYKPHNLLDLIGL